MPFVGVGPSAQSRSSLTFDGAPRAGWGSLGLAEPVLGIPKKLGCSWGLAVHRGRPMKTLESRRAAWGILVFGPGEEEFELRFAGTKGQGLRQSPDGPTKFPPL